MFSSAPLASPQLMETYSNASSFLSETQPSDPIFEEDVAGDVRLAINVGGSRHETFRSTLMRFPGTRLCKLASEHQEGNEYFFDRHPGVFAGVLNFYRTGEMHVPLDICGTLMKKELDFWQLSEELIEPCCWTSYSAFKEAQRTLAELDEDFEVEASEEGAAERKPERPPGCWRRTQIQVWRFLDEPYSSRAAKFFALLSFLFVVASIAGFCMETHPVFRVDPKPFPQQNRSYENGSYMEPAEVVKRPSVPHPILEILDLVCTAFFTAEFILRFTFSPSKLIFWRGPLNIIDFLSLLPLYMGIIIDLAASAESDTAHKTSFLKIILILRIIRIFRIFKLMKQYTALKILIYAVRASIKELMMLTVFLFLGVIIFASLIHYAEKNEDFDNIPIGFWWAIITMTTVGYGDIHPRTAPGYVVGTFCAICGVLVVALTIPIISNNFTLFYSHAQSRSKLSRKHRNRFRQKARPSVSTIDGAAEPEGEGEAKESPKDEEAPKDDETAKNEETIPLQSSRSDDTTAV